MQFIETQIEISAPIVVVWEVLIQFQNYANWNSFTPIVECDLVVGNDVILHVNMHPGKKPIIQKESLLHIKPLDSIAWGITSRFPVKTERIQRIHAISANTTLYYTSDSFEGILVPLVMALYKKQIQLGFNQVAKDLKKYCEKEAKKL